MKILDRRSAIDGAVLLLLSLPAEASHAHLAMPQKRHLHQRLHDQMRVSPRVDRAEVLVPETLQKRGNCQFPTGVGLVPVTPGSMNAGWAMSPDQQCLPNNYCPYACPPGQLMEQWDPAATSYTYPESMHGGLYCDSSGAISKPFPNKPYCSPGTGSVTVQNLCGELHSFCQTVLPGSESMLIQNVVTGTATLAVPGPEYWCSTAAHYYHNPPGISPEEGCIWGNGSRPIGNWAPYVSGANTDSNGNTFAKLAWNPIYIASGFANTLPNWGIKFVCSGCIGMPCSIDPSVNKVNEVTSPGSSTGAGGANFCVITIPKGVTATLVIFEVGGPSSPSSLSSATLAQHPTIQQPTQTSTQTPTPTPTPTSTLSTSTPHSSSSSTSSSLSPPPPPPPPSSSSSSTCINSTTLQSSTSQTTSATSTQFSVGPQVLFENNTATASNNYTAGTVSRVLGSSTSTITTASAPSATTTKSIAVEMLPPKSFGIGALFVAVVAFGWL